MKPGDFGVDGEIEWILQVCVPAPSNAPEFCDTNVMSFIRALLLFSICMGLNIKTYISKNKRPWLEAFIVGDAQLLNLYAIIRKNKRSCYGTLICQVSTLLPMLY